MNGNHKGHNIFVSAARRPATRYWEPRLTVIWSEEGKGKTNKLTVDRAFRYHKDNEIGLILSSNSSACFESRYAPIVPSIFAGLRKLSSGSEVDGFAIFASRLLISAKLNVNEQLSEAESNGSKPKNFLPGEPLFLRSP